MKASDQLSPGEAREALEIMEGSRRELRSLENRETGGYLVIWGLVYLLVPLTVLQMPHQANWLANLLIPLGAIATGVLASRSPVRSELGDRIGIFWLVAFAFAVVWIVILGGENFPELKISLDARQIWAFGVTIAMLVYVLMGLVFSSRLLMGLGFGVSAFTVAAFFMAWEWQAFWTWMAVCSGVPLLVAGLLCLFGGRNRLAS